MQMPEWRTKWQSWKNHVTGRHSMTRRDSTAVHPVLSFSNPAIWSFVYQTWFFRPPGIIPSSTGKTENRKTFNRAHFYLGRCNPHGVPKRFQILSVTLCSVDSLHRNFHWNSPVTCVFIPIARQNPRSVIFQFQFILKRANVKHDRT